MEEIEDSTNYSEDLYEHHNIIVDPGQEALRIDKYLMDRVANVSRNKVQLAAKNGNILVNGKAVRQNYKVKPKDEISIVFPYPVKDNEIIPQNIPITIDYEDDTLLIVNKSANMVVHPGYGNQAGTLVNALVYHFDNLPDVDREGRPGLVHRLDKNTTGIMVIAKTDDALSNLTSQFFHRTTHRTYHALVWGDVTEEAGTIVGALGRSQKDRKIMRVYEEDDEYGKHAVTHYKVLKRYGYVTLVECKLETGRTHQIRVHMKHIGHTLFGDPEYGGNKILKGTTFTKYKQFVANCIEICNRQALHAKTLGFVHPKTGEDMLFESELPKDFTDLLAKWENYAKNSKDFN